MELQGKTVAVTGAGSGIGRALAREFASQGAKVSICGRRTAPLDETMSLIISGVGHEPTGPAHAMARVADVTDPVAVKSWIESTNSAFGPIDVLYHNATAFRAIGATWELDPELWWNDVASNMLGAMICARAVLPQMIERGEGIFINMFGGGAAKPMPGGSAYGSSKAGQTRLTDTLAAELEAEGHTGVYVFAMSPGFVRTEATERHLETPAGDKWLGHKKRFEEGIDRPPEDCAEATVRLIRHACAEFNGRVFGPDDDFEALYKERARLRDKDLKQLRMRPFK